jgi:hypothetical protein
MSPKPQMCTIDEPADSSFFSTFLPETVCPTGSQLELHEMTQILATWCSPGNLKLINHKLGDGIFCQERIGPV